MAVFNSYVKLPEGNPHEDSQEQRRILGIFTKNSWVNTLKWALGNLRLCDFETPFFCAQQRWTDFPSTNDWSLCTRSSVGQRWFVSTPTGYPLIIKPLIRDFPLPQLIAGGQSWFPISGWWFGTFFIFIGNKTPNWRSHIFRGVGQPPTRLLSTIMKTIIITININH